MPPNASEIGQMIRLPTRAAGLRFEEDPTSSESPRRHAARCSRRASGDSAAAAVHARRAVSAPHRGWTAHAGRLSRARAASKARSRSARKRSSRICRTTCRRELPKVLNALVSIEQDGHETVGRKRAPWSDRFAGKSRALVDTFVENRLFVTELADDGSAVVTVAHEALLWHWPRVMDWVAQNRENLRVRARIARRRRALVSREQAHRSAAAARQAAGRGGVAARARHRAAR